MGPDKAKSPVWGFSPPLATANRISLDWLLFGDLRGLQRTTRWRRQAGSADSDEIQLSAVARQVLDDGKPLLGVLDGRAVVL
jgi:hypothetical protein